MTTPIDSLVVDTFAPEKEGQEEPRPQQTPGFVHGNLIAEVVADQDGRLRFATNNSTTVQRELSRGGSVVIPPYALQAFVDTRSLRLPAKASRGSAVSELENEIKAFIRRWAEIPADWLEPIAHYILMSWMYDRFTAVPYLRFLGEYGTGKTRMLQVVGAICYRPFAVSGNITGAALFRSIHLIQGTLVVDEGDFKNSEEWSDITKILNNGYTPGFPVFRCRRGDFTPEPFYVYGPKVISTRHRFGDAATESRCLTFETQETRIDPRIPLQLNPAFESEALALRNKLLGFRFDRFFCIAADDSLLRNLDGRLAQIGSSLVAVAHDKEAVVKFLDRYAQSAKEDSPKEVVRGVLEKCPERAPRVKEITKSVNLELEGSGLPMVTEKAVGSIVRSMGFKTKRRSTGFVILKDERMNVDPAIRGER